MLQHVAFGEAVGFSKGVGVGRVLRVCVRASADGDFGAVQWRGRVELLYDLRAPLRGASAGLALYYRCCAACCLACLGKAEFVDGRGGVGAFPAGWRMEAGFCVGQYREINARRASAVLVGESCGVARLLTRGSCACGDLRGTELLDSPKLGEGAGCVGVYAVVDTTNGRQVAVKTVDRTREGT